MTLFIAVDGGNSKTDVVVGDVAGRVHAYVRGPGSSPHNLGLPGARRVLDELVGKALSAAGVGDVDLASVFLAGADLPIEVEQLTAELSTQGWAPRTVVDNDTFALLRTGTAARDAVAVVCGAGTNCVGRRADGRTARFPALGQLSGDWGGGHHLAQLALYHAARGEDGRGPDTALIRAVAECFEMSTVEDVSVALHLGEVALEKMYQLSRVLFAVAAAGDPVARRIVQRQANEVVAFARVAAARLDLLGEPHAVVLGGGVLSARHPLLHDAVVEGILAIAPKATIGIATEPPVVGAALLAMDALLGGPTPAASEDAMRVALRSAPLELPAH
jgi:N-acetylglucosamine kinase-like BadF-type ATPase